jgi:hypothetical protein
VGAIVAVAMGGSRVQVNKAHKSRFSSKSYRNLHKTSLKGVAILILLNSYFLFSAGSIENPRNIKEKKEKKRKRRFCFVLFWFSNMENALQACHMVPLGKSERENWFYEFS